MNIKSALNDFRFTFLGSYKKRLKIIKGQLK